MLREINETIIQKKVKEKIDGKLILSSTSSAKFILSYGDIIIEVQGDVAQEAMNQPTDATRIEKQMRKTGNTEFEFERLDIELLGNLFIPMQSLNDLRRRGLETLQEKILEQYRRNLEQTYDCALEKQETVGRVREEINSFYVYVEQLEQFEEVVTKDCVKRIYLDANAIRFVVDNPKTLEVIKAAHFHKKEIYLGLPHIFRRNTGKQFETYYDNLIAQGWDGLLIRNYESYQFLLEKGYKGSIVTDYSLYQFNRYAKQFWKNEQVDSFTAPLELNFKELKEVGLEDSELVVYGHLPMMVSAQCITKTTKGCQKQWGKITFKDRYQKEFTAKCNCDYCYNIIYNTAPVLLTDQKEEILELAPKALRLHFTIEDKAKVNEVLCLYEDVFRKGCEPKEPSMEFTRGHFKRGIK